MNKKHRLQEWKCKMEDWIHEYCWINTSDSCMQKNSLEWCKFWECTPCEMFTRHLKQLHQKQSEMLTQIRNRQLPPLSKVTMYLRLYTYCKLSYNLAKFYFKYKLWPNHFAQFADFGCDMNGDVEIWSRLFLETILQTTNNQKYSPSWKLHRTNHS